MKKRYVEFVVVLLVGLMIGGTVVANNSGASWVNALNGKTAKVEAASDNTAEAQSTYYGSPMNVADIADKAGPAVVNIESQITVGSSSASPYINDPFFRQFFGEQMQVQPQNSYETGIGTGFLISSDGYILTNQHVIDNAAKVVVTLAGKKEKIPAIVVGQDDDLDLAVLKISGTNYPTLPLGDSDKMRVGDGVVAIGEPYGLDHTVTTGVVSAKGRPVTIEDRSYKNLIQTDAAINPGNSGGPLLNLKGEVIAINTAINASAQGIGFAIPINTARDVLNQLKNGEKVEHPYLGIRMSNITDQAINELKLDSGTTGALVVEVMADSPAAKYGILNLDIIQKIDGKTMESAEDVQNAVAAGKVGESISMEVLRQGRTIKLQVVLQAKP